MPSKKASARDHRYKMADLVELTKTGREAIRFYISAGLLPKPSKTSRNMAWYTDRHVELIKLIRKLQEEQFLPLKAIKSILHGTSDFTFTESQMQFITAMNTELHDRHVHLLPKAVKAPPEARAVPEKDLAVLEKMGWIRRKGGKLQEDDHEIVDAWASFLDSGLSDVPGVGPEVLGYILEGVDLMFERGMEFSKKYLSNIRPDDAANMVIRAQPAVIQMFSALYERRIRKIFRSVSTRTAPSSVGKSRAAGRVAAAKRVRRTSR